MDKATSVVRFPRDVVRRAMATRAAHVHDGARNPDFDLHLEEGTSYYTLDGCGVAALDPETREERPSRKSDLEAQARVADWLPGIGFIWPTVSAQDYGRTSQLHEIDAAYNNTVKHFQAMVMGEEAARFAVEMATVVAGSADELRRRPVLSNLICSVAPLSQDHAGLESALVMAEAGIPIGVLSMPTLGTTAPSTSAGAFVVGDAECISGIVLLQLAYPGAPVFHSIMKAYADPRTGTYVGYSLNSGTARYAPVEMAHHWGVPSMAACFGTDSPMPGTWLAGVRRRPRPAARRALGRRAGHGPGPRPHVHAAHAGGDPPRLRALRAGALRARGRSRSTTRRSRSTSSRTSARAATTWPRSTPAST